MTEGDSRADLMARLAELDRQESAQLERERQRLSTNAAPAPLSALRRRSHTVIAQSGGATAPAAYTSTPITISACPVLQRYDVESNPRPPRYSAPSPVYEAEALHHPARQTPQPTHSAYPSWYAEQAHVHLQPKQTAQRVQHPVRARSQSPAPHAPRDRPLSLEDRKDEEDREHRRDMQKMMLLLAQTQLQSSQPPRRSPTFARTFSGRPEESPKQFIAQAEHYVNSAGFREDYEKIDAVRAALRGEAKEWANSFIYTPMSFERFAERFLSEYNSPTRLAAAYQQVYGVYQTPTERAEAFISRKQALVNRLPYHIDEEVMVVVVATMLRPEIASRIVGTRPATLEELIQLVSSIEVEVNRESAWREAEAKGAQTYRQPQQAPRQPQQAPRGVQHPTAACRWCGGNHFHRECEHNPYNAPPKPSGNGQQAVAGRNNSQPQSRTQQGPPNATARPAQATGVRVETQQSPHTSVLNPGAPGRQQGPPPPRSADQRQPPPRNQNYPPRKGPGGNAGPERR